MWKCYVRAMCARFVICASLFPTIHCLFAGSLLAVRPGIGLRITEETQKQKRRDHFFPPCGVTTPSEPSFTTRSHDGRGILPRDQLVRQFHDDFCRTMGRALWSEPCDLGHGVAKPHDSQWKIDFTNQITKSIQMANPMISVLKFFSYRSFKWGMWLSLRRLGGTTYWMALGLVSSPMAATMPRGWIQSLLISPWTLWRFRALGLQGRGRDSEASEASTSWMVQPNYMHSLSKV